MTQRRRDTKAILKRVARSERRSPLFHWMVEHHDELLEASGRDGIFWTSFCEEVSKKGITDTRGLPPSEHNARKTWAQARRAVREARAQLAAEPPKPVYPSRMPKDWVPPEMLAAIAAGNPAVGGIAPAPAGANALVPSPDRGLALRTVPPAPVSAPKAGPDRPISQFADPDDPPEVHEVYASLEQQFDKADWYLLAGKPKKRRTE